MRGTGSKRPIRIDENGAPRSVLGAERESPIPRGEPQDRFAKVRKQERGRDKIPEIAPRFQGTTGSARGAPRYLQHGLKIVAIGGGSGLSTLLQGLKAYTDNVIAIVTVADDGGSSGRLREEFGILPPGDIRNCLVALAEAEPLMQRLFQHRFTGDGALGGHNFGNLFVTALTQVTGDFEHAIDAASRVLAIRGRVIPPTYANVQLVAQHDNGSLTIGESRISQAPRPIRRLWLEPVNPPPLPDALKAIREADLIVIGPGSLFTSLIPNLLVPGIVEAILQSSALKMYVCNVMTQFRETKDFTASDHVRALVAQSHPGILQVCIVNTGAVPEPRLASYRKEQAVPVEPDLERIRGLGYHVVADNLLTRDNHVRHDSQKLARLVIQIGLGGRRSGLRPFNANGSVSAPKADSRGANDHQSACAYLA